MLANKILVFLWMALIAILVIENMVLNLPAYFFWIASSRVWIVALSTAIIWVFIWFWFRWIFDWKNNKYEDEDNFDF